MQKMPKPWSVLYGEDSGEYSIVVPNGEVDGAEALAELLGEQAGVYVAKDHPIIALKTREFELKPELWSSCTKQYREDNNVDDWYQDYWAPDGDGKRHIWVVTLPQDVWAVADLIETYGEDAVNEIQPDQAKFKRRERRKLWLKARSKSKTKLGWRSFMMFDSEQTNDT